MQRKQRNPLRPYLRSFINDFDSNERFGEDEAQALSTEIYESSAALRKSEAFGSWARYADQASTRAKPGSNVLRLELIKADRIKERFYDTYADWQESRTAAQAAKKIKRLRQLLGDWHRAEKSFYSKAAAILP